MHKLIEMSIDTLQELYAFQFFRVYKKLPTSAHLETNPDYLRAKIGYLQKIKQPLL